MGAARRGSAEPERLEEKRLAKADACIMNVHKMFMFWPYLSAFCAQDVDIGHLA